MKIIRSNWTIAIIGLFTVLDCTADQTQTITLSVPAEINWPQADVNEAFVKGPPFLRCEIHGANAPSNPTSSDYLALGFDKPLASASQPLMVDASGHYSGKISLSFMVSADTLSKAPGLSYWCYLAPTDTRATYLDGLATARGLKIEVNQGSTWQSIKK